MNDNKICILLTLVCTVVALVLGIVILTKINKKGYCRQSFARQRPKMNGMILKDAQACLGLDQNSVTYQCGKWAQDAKNNQPCVSDNGTDMNCGTINDDYGPMACCNVICDQNSDWQTNPDTTCDGGNYQN